VGRHRGIHTRIAELSQSYSVFEYCRGSRESGEPTVLEKSNLTDLAGDSFFCRDSLFEFGTRLVPGDEIQWKRSPGGERSEV